MATRPNIQDGFLGGQPRMGEVKLEVDSHKKAEFKVSGDPSVAIKMKTGVPVKVVTKLTQCDGDKEHPELVLVQRKEGCVIFKIAFPANGFYKFSIFALPESEPGDQLPGVYNYLIEVERNHHKVFPYVKAYTKFYADWCYLDKPKFINNDATKKLDKVKFDMKVPGAKKVAIHAGEKWYQLTKKRGDDWEGTVDLSEHQGKDTKVTVNGNYDEAGSSYSVLLEYKV